MKADASLFQIGSKHPTRWIIDAVENVERRNG
jgi:hypothetical protein